MDPTGDTSSATMDYESAADRIGASLGEDLIGKLDDPSERPGLSTQDTTPVVQPAPAAPSPSPTTYEVPKSWKREMHEHWGKVTPEAQAYIIEREKQLLNGFDSFRPIQEAIAPHQEFLSRLQVAPAQAVGFLLNAHRRLTEGTTDQRLAAYQELGKQLQLGQAEALAQAPPAEPVDPALRSIQDKIAAMERAMNAEREAQIETIRSENRKSVDAFAADTTAHPYFDEVANEMAILISQGQSLQDAYENAVWMNPATRAKEQAKAQTAHEAKLKETARLNALPKRKAASVNLQSNGDGPEPTEPVGSLMDTIKSVHKQIRSRS